MVIAVPEEENFGKKAAVFLIKFFLIYGVLQAAILLAPIGWLKAGIASLEASALGLQSEGSTIAYNSHSFEIAANCTGLMSSAVLAAIVFSLRKPGIWKKILLVAVGSAALFLLNLLRVYFVLLAATAFNPAAAETLHTATWFAVAAIILLLWYKLTARIAGTKAFAEML